MPPGVPQANFAGIPGAIAFGAAGGNLPGQFPGALPASGSFINPTAAAAASQRQATGPALGPSPSPVGPPPANRAAALAAAISNAGQTQFGQNQTPIPGTLPQFLMGREGPNNMFNAFLSGQGTAQQGQSALAGNGPQLSAIAQQADPNAQSQLAGNSATGAGGLLTPEMIDQLVADNPFLSREVLEQVLADNTVAGQQFVQQLLAGRGFNTGGGGQGATFDGSGVLNLGNTGAGTGDPNTPAGGASILDALRGGSPGLPGSNIPGASGLLAASGAFGTTDNENPLISSLPGGKGADDVIAVILAQMANEAGLQTQRSEEATDSLRNNAARLSTSPAQILADQTALAANQRIQPGSLDEIMASLQGNLDTSQAALRNANLNSAQDRGLLGQGAASTAALGGINNRLNAQRQQGQFDITRMMEELTGQRIGQAAGVAPASAQVTQALTQNPLLNLAQTLQGPRNPAQNDLQDFLKGVLNLQIGSSLADRGPSNFESVAPLLGNLIGAGGDIGSAFIKNR